MIKDQAEDQQIDLGGRLLEQSSTMRLVSFLPPVCAIFLKHDEGVWLHFFNHLA